MIDAKGFKGNRRAFADRHISGRHDDIVADGTARSVMPLWWHTW